MVVGGFHEGEQKSNDGCDEGCNCGRHSSENGRSSSPILCSTELKLLTRPPCAQGEETSLARELGAKKRISQGCTQCSHM